MMESLFVRQSEEMNARLEEAVARREKANAEMKADLRATVAARMAANQAEMLACPEEMEANMSSEEMEATNLEATLEATEAAVERQELFKEETNFENIESSEDRSGY
jgi:hypothetical protein